METDFEAGAVGPIPQKPLISRVAVTLGVIAVVVLVALLIWGIIWVAGNYPTAIETLRDIVIIALALGSCLFSIAFLIMLVMIIRLVNMLEFEIKPILQQTSDTLATVRGTTTFVSQNVVKPVVNAGGFVAGARRTLQVLFGEPRWPD